jgi:hypothetical protein
MSRRDRRPRHISAADHLLPIGGPDDDDIIEVVAAHLLDAYEAVPDAEDAAQLRGRARDAQLRAGERAASLGANLAAQGYFVRAASLADEPHAEAEHLERAGQMAGIGARSDDASALFHRARELFDAAGSVHAAARVSAREAEIMWDQGRLREGLESMDRAFQLMTGDQPDADLASLAAQIGRFAFFAGNGEMGLERVETALAIAEQLDIPEVLSQALNTKALILGSRGRDHESRALMRYALDVALEHDKPSAALRAYNNLADFFMADDRLADAQRTVEEGLLLARRVGNRYWEEIFLGVIYPRFALGDWSAALASIEELGGWDTHTQARTAFTQGAVAFGTAIHASRGELDSAERIIHSFADLADSPDSQERLEIAFAQAFLAWSAGDAAAAARVAEVASRAANDLGRSDHRVKEAWALSVEAMLIDGNLEGASRALDAEAASPGSQRRHFKLAQTMRLRAKLGIAAGANSGAEDNLKGAIGLFREMAHRYWTARTLLEQGEWLASHERAAEALVALDECREMFAALEAAPWVARVDAAREALSGMPAA